MKLSNTLLLAAVLTAPAIAERTKTEVVKATTPEQDAKDNSDKVPDVYAIPAQIKNVLVLRFKYKADLLAGIEEMVKKHKIRNAVFLSGIGSVRNYHIHGVSNRTFPSKNMFVKDDDAPADIISVNGYVIEGRVHAHMTLANDERAFGGHMEPGNPVFTFAIITLGILEDSVTLDKVDDKTFR